VGPSELETYSQNIESIRTQARELTQGLTEQQFNWRPAADQWSIEECMAHLTMVGQWEVRAIEQAIEDGRARGLTGNGPFEYRAIDRLIVDLSRPPVRMRVPAPRQFVPLHGQPLTAILPTFLHVQSQFLLQMEKADGLDLRRVKVPTPISRFVKMSLGMMFAQAAAHEQRHIEQAWRVRRKLPL
jgi:DinB family protein